MSLENAIPQSTFAALGIDALGIVRAQTLEHSHRAYQMAVLGNMPSGLEYLERHVPLKRTVDELLPNCKTLIVCAFALPKIQRTDAIQLARFCALGDYHQVIRQRLEMLCLQLQNDGDFKYRICIDSAPLLERAWAVLAGLGVLGQNRLLIHPELGSHILLGTVLCDKDFWSKRHALNFKCESPQTVDAQASDSENAHCDALYPGRLCAPTNSCNACIRACPTAALSSDGYDVKRCLAYWSTQDKQGIPENFAKAMGSCLWGCDICQNACPHNANRPATSYTKSILEQLSLAEILESSSKQLQKKLAQSPLNHARPYAIQRNACIVIGNMGLKNYLPQLKHLADKSPCDWLRNAAQHNINLLRISK